MLFSIDRLILRITLGSTDLILEPNIILLNSAGSMVFNSINLLEAR